MECLESLNQTTEPLLKRYQRLPRKYRFGARWISDKARDIESAGRRKADRAARVTNLNGKRGKLSKRRRPAADQVYGWRRRMTRVEKFNKGGDAVRDIVDMRKIEGVIRSVDSQFGSESSSARECRNYAVGMVSRRAKHVGKPDDASP